MRKGQPFSRAVFAQVGSRAAVDKALSKLVRSGLLERVARGIYMRPKLSAYTGRWVRPSPLSIMSVITKANGETIQIHGAEAVRRLGLSTQMQVVRRATLRLVMRWFVSCMRRVIACNMLERR